LAVNPEPFTVSVKAGPPACVIDGLRLLMAAFTVAAEMVKAAAFDTVPLVLTVIVADP
jgi:hypothetical protein